jgi:hypothetical protein
MTSRPKTYASSSGSGSGKIFLRGLAARGVQRKKLSGSSGLMMSGFAAAGAGGGCRRTPHSLRLSTRYAAPIHFAPPSKQSAMSIEEITDDFDGDDEEDIFSELLQNSNLGLLPATLPSFLLLALRNRYCNQCVFLFSIATFFHCTIVSC